MAASVGVVMCLRGMRRSRSGAVRRLFLWLMLATATFLQGCGVGLELQHLSQGGLTSFCVSGWLLTPATPVILLNNMSTPITPHPPKIVPQQPHTLSTIATTTLSPPPSPPPSDGSHETGTTVNPHLKHTSSYRPAPPNTTTTSTTTTPVPTTTTIVIPTFIPLLPVTPTKTTTTTTVPATTTRTTTSPVTTTSIHPTVPAVKTSTKKSNFKIPLKNTVSTVESLSSSDDGDTKESHRPPVGQGKHQAEHQPRIPARNGGPRKHHYNNIQRPHVSLENHGRGKTFGKIDYPMNPKNTQLSDDSDQPTSQDSSEDNDGNHLQYEDEYDNNNEESEEKGDEDDHEDDLSKLFNYYPKLASHFRSSFGKLPQSEGNALLGAPKTVNFLDIPPNSLQDNVPTEGNAALWKSYFKGINNKAENSFQNPQHTDHFTTTKRKQSKLSEQDSLSPISSLRHHSHKSMPPMTDTRRPHHPSFQIQEPSDGEGQYSDYLLHQIGSRHSLHKRSLRRNLKTKSKSHVHPVKVTTNETKLQHDEKLENKQNLIEVKSETIMVGVAMLLVLGGLAGAGVEAGVAQLWHCFIHGYDEGGVSQDVLQRTITHTFHLSTYGNHKTWTGITSGGWVMGAGVVSILACMAGTGGGGYGGLLGVHLALGTGALLLLLLLPVPYGSIDPPRTRRPLSLYLDDEVT